MDNLSKLIEGQRSLMKEFYSLPPEDWEEKVKEALLALVVETIEVLNELNWKPWKKEKKKVNKEKLKEEVVDCLHFLLEIIILIGMTEEEIIERYFEKRKRNIERVRGGY